VFLGTGCSSSHYRKAADEQVYGIIQTVEDHVFGRTNEFNIDTEWSGRDPQEIAPEEILRDRTSTNLLVLDLEETLRLAVETSRSYQSQKEQLYLTALNLTGQQQRFTPQFFGSLTPQLAGNGSGELSGSLNPQVGFSQLLKSGGNLSVQLVNDLFRYYTGDPRESVMSVLSVNVAQPILRGLGKNSDAVEALTQSQRDVVYAVRSYGQFQKQFDVDIVNEYFSLLALKDTVRNNYTNYLRRVETTRYVAARAPNRARQSEVDDARASELGARISYINSVASYLSQVDAFKITLGLPISQQLYLDDRDLAALGQVGLIPAAVDQEHAFGLAVENHADILNAIDQFEDRKRKVRIAADKLKTQVTLIGSASYRADEEEEYTNFDPDKFNYGVGLQIDLPFNRLPERNAYRATLVQFEQELRGLGLTLDDFKNRIDRGLRTLEQRRLNFLNRVAQLDVNRRRVEQNQLLLEAGRVQIREVRESQDLLIQAQNELIFTRVQYQEARLQLLLDMGMMQTDAPAFWLTDPLAGMIKEEEQRGVNPLKMPEDELVPPDQFLEARHDKR
jgi:hypothetical protein